MKRNVHPLVAVVLIAVCLGAVWYAYTTVFHGKSTGYVGSPGTPGGAPINMTEEEKAARKPPPGPPTRELYGLPPLEPKAETKAETKGAPTAEPGKK